MQRNCQISYGRINIPTLVWNILDRARVYKPEAKRCLLYLTEKYLMIFSKLNLLNSRNELVTKFSHETKFYLTNFKDHVTYKYY